MGFLNPWMLAAVAGVGIPVAIHLLNKFRVRKSPWAAMRFVRDSLRKNQRRLQMEDLLLLLLRCLIVLLLALAFARPVLRSLAEGGAATDGPVTTVVLLDNSASMGQSDGIETRFTAGKRAILESLEHVAPGSRLALSLVSNRTETLIARPETDFARFRRSLELATLSDRSTDLLRGLQVATASLQGMEGARKEVRIYTDSQLPAWPGRADIEKFRADHPDILFRPVPLGSGGENNLAVTGLTIEGGMASATQPSRVRIQVANFGTAPAERVRVTLALDQGPPSNEALLDRIEPGSSRAVDLFARFETAGYHAVTAEIPPDRLPVDNRRSVAIRVAGRTEVLVVEGTPAGLDGGSDAFFLANALAPVSPIRREDHYLHVRTAPFAELARTPLDGFHTVFLNNPPTPDVATAAALVKYLRAGGNLVLFPGDATIPDAWNTSPLAEFLPAELGPRVESPTPVPFQNEGFDHPVTTIWNDPAEGRLGAARSTAWFPLKLAEENPPAAVILRLSNGAIAAAERSAGGGRVVLFNGPATPEGNTLVLHPGFVALMQRLMGFLHRGAEGRTALLPGETFETPVPMELLGRDFSVARPGENPTPRPAGRVELSGQQAVIRYGDTETAGVYQVFIAPDERPAAAFAVQLDPAESDLRQAPAADMDALAAPASGAVMPDGERQRTYQVKTEYWGALLLAVAALLLFETFLSHRMSWSR